MSEPDAASAADPDAASAAAPLWFQTAAIPNGGRIHTAVPSVRLAFAVYGCAVVAADTRSVLFLPGAGLGRLACPLSDEQLRQMRVRLIVCDRPGYGDSETFGLDAPQQSDIGKLWAMQAAQIMPAFAAQLDQLLSHLGVAADEKIDVIAHSAGCLYAIVFATSFPHRVRSLSVAGPPTPLLGDPHPTESGIARRLQSWLLRMFPGMLAAVFKGQIAKWIADPAQFGAFSEGQMAEREKKEIAAEANQKMVRAFASAMRSGTPEAAAGAESAAARVMLMELFVTSVLPLPLEWNAAAMRAFPRHVWFGTMDSTTPHGAWLAELWQKGAQADEPAAGHAQADAAPAAAASAMHPAAAAALPAPVTAHPADGYSHALIFPLFERILRTVVEA